ncbi:MAG: GerMN domain-containing protein [Clostridia bacterium]|nr:GerMN domain-containing protein [Clostridia bacterium]
MKSRRILLLAALSLVLFTAGGCMPAIRETAPAASLPEIKAGTTSPLADEAVDETFSGILCFLSDNGQQLVRVSRKMTLHNGESRPVAVMNALLSGPQETERGTWPEVRGTTSARIEVSGKIATVLLPARYRSLEPDVLYSVRTAMAESLLSLAEIEYVNVLVGNREEGVDLAGSVPAGTFIHHSDSRISSLYAGFDELRISGESFSSLVTLYYPSQDGRYLLPFIRNVRFERPSPIEYMNTLLEELGKGGDFEGGKTDVPSPMVYLDEMPEIVRDHNGRDRVMTLFFSSEIDAALDAAALSRETWFGMIAETLLTFVPNVDGLEISVGKQLVKKLDSDKTTSGKLVTFENGLIQRTHFEHLLGAVAIGYQPDESEEMMTAFQMILPAAKAGDAHAILAALLESDETKEIMPSNTDAADVLAIRTERELLAVNLSERFGKAFESLDSMKRRLCIYSMVNTLTEGEKDRVIFFFGGIQPESDDSLELRGSFVRAPGLIR